MTQTVHSPARQVLQEQIAIVGRHRITMAISGLAGAGALIYLLHDHVSPARWLPWLLFALLGVSVVPPAVALWLRRRPTTSFEGKRWQRLLTLQAVFGGGAWGSGGILLFAPHSIAHQLILLVFMLAGATLLSISLAALARPFYAALLPLLLPITISFLTASDQPLLAVCPLIYGVTLAYFYRINHDTLLEALRLRFDLAATAAALTEQKTRAEEANLAKSRFIAAASHDLRQPLHAQGLFLSELKVRSRHTPLAPIVQQLDASTEHMRHLFNSLLDLSKLDAAAVTPCVTDFALQPIFDQLMIDYAGRALDKELRFQVRQSPLIVRSDPLLLTRILRNLVENAVQHTISGGILLGCRQRRGQVIVQVCDTGPGIPSDLQADIFREFYQAPASKSDASTGVGLGLAIVERLSGLLGHTVEVRSVVGKGSCFSITLPRSAQVLQVAPAASTVTLAEPPPDALVGTRILVVDDDPLVREAMTLLLAAWGCRVRTLASLSAKTSIAKQIPARPEAIVADYHLAGNRNGIEIIRLVERHFANPIPAVIITGEMSPERLSAVMNSGVPVLHKPVAPEKLRETLNRLIQAQKTDIKAPTDSDRTTHPTLT